MGSRLVTLLEGTFKVEPVKELSNGKYAYKLQVKKIVGFKKFTGIWRILQTRKVYAGTEYTFQQVSK